MQILSIGQILLVLEEFLVFPKDIKDQFDQQIKRKKVYLIPPIQIIAKYNNVNYELRHDEEIEELIDSQVALERMWELVFSKKPIPEGRVLFYPSLFNLQEKAGVICDSKELKDFLFTGYKRFYDELPNVGIRDFYFIFLDALIFFGFEHPGVCYSFGLKDIAKD